MQPQGSQAGGNKSCRWCWRVLWLQLAVVIAAVLNFLQQQVLLLVQQQVTWLMLGKVRFGDRCCVPVMLFAMLPTSLQISYAPSLWLADNLSYSRLAIVHVIAMQV